MRMIIAVSLLLISSGAQALTDTEKRADSAVTVLGEMMAIPESSIPEKLLAEAYAIAVVPNVGEAGFVFGGRFGKGLISIRGKDGAWSNPNYIKLTGGSVGFQAGIQESDVILVFTKPDGVDSIVKGNRAITADTALRLGLYFGTSAEMWLNLQSQYDLRVAQRTTWPAIKSRIKTRKVA